MLMHLKAWMSNLEDMNSILKIDSMKIKMCDVVVDLLQSFSVSRNYIVNYWQCVIRENYCSSVEFYAVTC